MRLKLLIYDLELVYVPEKLMYVADLLFRDHSYEIYNEVKTCGTVNFVNSDSCISNDQLCEETKKDPILKQVFEMIKNWLNNKESIPIELRYYWKLRSDIFINSDIIFFKNRIIVPSNLHSDHKGIVKSKLRAEEMFYWPAMTNEIENYITKYKICEKYQVINVKKLLLGQNIPGLYGIN